MVGSFTSNFFEIFADSNPQDTCYLTKAKPLNSNQLQNNNVYKNHSTPMV